MYISNVYPKCRPVKGDLDGRERGWMRPCRASAGNLGTHRDGSPQPDSPVQRAYRDQFSSRVEGNRCSSRTACTSPLSGRARMRASEVPMASSVPSAEYAIAVTKPPRKGRSNAPSSSLLSMAHIRISSSRAVATSRRSGLIASASSCCLKESNEYPNSPVWPLRTST